MPLDPKKSTWQQAQNKAQAKLDHEDFLNTPLTRRQLRHLFLGRALMWLPISAITVTLAGISLATILPTVLAIVGVEAVSYYSISRGGV